jgi:hypothetical protein
MRKDNDDLKDQRDMFKNQMVSLKNVNESQAKLLTFLQDAPCASEEPYLQPGDKYEEP